MDEIISIKPAPKSKLVTTLTQVTAFLLKTRNKLKLLSSNLYRKYILLKSYVLKKTHTASPAIPFIWFGVSTVTTIFVLGFLITTITTPVKSPNNKYSIFSSKPLILGISTEKVFGNDSRAAVLDKVYASYGCPLTGLGEVYVKEADANNIPYWIVPAISFQESSCGKLTPKKDGIESNNAWGWGVWGDNVAMFDSWEHGIQVVSAYMSERFYSRGVTEPCEMMKVYTPPSKGTWCNGVYFFKDVIVHYKTP
jgi:hypothetical protein